uniref:Putative radical SAM superfamily protein n=1 Tax=viral metagenome TaxID=1070528 RepID=A0A6M3IJY9_9ZZZZ
MTPRDVSIPNENNFCGGSFPDWLEVNLIDKCNGKCSWCIEKSGYHPKTHLPWKKIVGEIIKTGKKNIILLGGEPTLFKDLRLLIDLLNDFDKNVYLTTNGSLLSPDYVRKNFTNLHALNISIHHYDSARNLQIIGLLIDYNLIKDSITELHKNNVSVRLNCNCISGEIDSEEEIFKYIRFAKTVGADKVRFAELKDDKSNFVDLAMIMKYEYGLNDDPFLLGCNKDVVINGMPVNFRQMCGLQTDLKKKPINPKQIVKKVLYYDGKLYDGWQRTFPKENTMNEKDLEILLSGVESGDVPVSEAMRLIFSEMKKMREISQEIIRKTHLSSGGCQY